MRASDCSEAGSQNSELRTQNSELRTQNERAGENNRSQECLNSGKTGLIMINIIINQKGRRVEVPRGHAAVKGESFPDATVRYLKLYVSLHMVSTEIREGG